MSQKLTPFESTATEVMDFFDIFSTQAHLTLHKKRTLETTLGGLLTITLVIIILYQTTSDFVGMVNHENPLVYQITELEETPAIVNLSPKDNFFMAILITVDSVIANLSDASPFNFPTNYVQRRKTLDGKITTKQYPVYWAPCNQSDFPDSIYGKDTYTKDGFVYAYCATGVNMRDSTTGICPGEIAKDYPDCITPPDFNIQGTLFTEAFDYVQSNLRLCDQSDTTLPSKMKCSSDPAAQFKASRFELDLYFANAGLDVNNYKAPNITIVDDVYWIPTPSIYKVIDVFIDRVTVQDSDDYYSSSVLNNKSFYMVNSAGMKEHEKVLTTASTNILQWNLLRSHRNLVYSRTYSKFNDFLSDLGGFSKAAMFVCAFLAIGYVRYKYFMLVANELYDFDMPYDKNLQRVIRRNTTLFSLQEVDGDPLNKDTPRSPISLTGFKSIDFQSRKPVLDYYYSQKRRRQLRHDEIHYFKMMFRIMFCKDNADTTLAIKARRLASKDLDLIKSIKKFKEVEWLKLLFLNRDQREIFEIMDKGNVEKIVKEAEIQASIKPIAVKKRLNNNDNFEIQTCPTEPDDLTSTEYKERKKVSEDEFPVLSRYARLYVAYRYLKNDVDPDNAVLNRKLLGSLNRSIRLIFKSMNSILEDEYTCEQLEDIVYEAFEDPIEMRLK